MSELALKLIAENKAKFARGENARSLDLGNCGLTEVPEEIGELVWLEELILSSRWQTWDETRSRWALVKYSSNDGTTNKIVDISTVISKLRSLKSIVIPRIGLKSLNSIALITSLEQIYCAHNELSILPNLSLLKKLRILDLSYNNLSEIYQVVELFCLEIIDIKHNMIESLPNLSTLNSLRFIFFSNNKIGNISYLTNSTIAGIECENNQIQDLTPILNYIKKGIKVSIVKNSDNSKKLIYIGNNPLKTPPLEIVNQGNQAILEYFHQKEKTGETPLLEAKLILMGDGRSGKTSLANRLINKPMPTEVDRTQGVDIVIGEYRFDVANQMKFQLNIWDFAGQDKYKPLHQFFYTESSLYVMVADSGNPRTDFEDWLQTAELFGEGSPLILVLNEFRDGIGFGTFDREIWQKRFPNLLKEVFCVNLGTKRGLEALEHHIRLLAQSLSHTQYPYPNNWAAIRRELEARRDENFISEKEYFRICRDNQLPEKESALVLAQVLHKIGVCLHYQKNELLKQVVILKNEWATEAVYKILDDTIVAEDKKGFFDRNDLERIWSDETYSDMRPQLLELMQQFKMAYPLPGSQRFVTPPLLQGAPPEDWKWPEGDQLEFYIEYEFIPKALMTQFIVSRHPDIDQGKTLVWRNGVVLRWPGEALAQVLQTKLQGKDVFYIRSQGRDRKGMMTVILKTFRELHEEYKGIKLEEKVPCSCSGCKSGMNKQHYFEYRKLQNWLAKGVQERDCDESLETINLLQLLENQFIFEKTETGQPLTLKINLDTPNMEKPKKVFISYSKSDKDYLVALKKQLSPFIRAGQLTTWDDTDLVPGQSWDAAIRQELGSADIIVLLVSADLMATDYIWNVEMKDALEREKQGLVTVIPVIIRSCAWTSAPFAYLNALPEKGKPVSTWSNTDDAWAEVVAKIGKVL